MITFGSYSPEDVKFLVKDLSSVLTELPTSEYEARVQRGQHYAELLPVEECHPPAEAVQLFHCVLEQSARRLALAVGIAAEAVLAQHGEAPVIVSLAQTGTPIGVLLRRWIAWRHQLTPMHYTISIVRGRGIDHNAFRYICDRHGNDAIQFVDSWTGKGAIARELSRSVRALMGASGRAPDGLAVLADPGDCAAIRGASEDLLVPNACLNATVSGLVSRTVTAPGLIGPDDFDGAKYYRFLTDQDVSIDFVDAVAEQFPAAVEDVDARKGEGDRNGHPPSWRVWRQAQQLADEYGLDDVNHVKAGVSETVRMLLYRRAWRVLLGPGEGVDRDAVLQLAARRGVPIEQRADLGLTAIGLMGSSRMPSSNGAEHS
jgi:phosphoribosyl transferase-like protein/RNA binding Pelota-like protein